MQPLSPDDIEAEITADGNTYKIKVFPEGPIGLEQVGDGTNSIVISHRVWPAIISHAETAEKGEVLTRSQAGIPTSITADGDGGIELSQAYGADVIQLPRAVVQSADEHIQLTRFKLQGRGFESGGGL